MAMTDEMLEIATKIKPKYCCIVPERREELTTEGGLNVKNDIAKITEGCRQLLDAGVLVSLFIDADYEQIEATITTGAPFIEIHTGKFADAENQKKALTQLKEIENAASHANNLGLKVNAGHGLNYDNVKSIVAIPQIRELNIGHSIIARAVFVGLTQAIKDMKMLVIN